MNCVKPKVPGFQKPFSNNDLIQGAPAKLKFLGQDDYVITDEDKIKKGYINRGYRFKLTLAIKNQGEKTCTFTLFEDVLKTAANTPPKTIKSLQNYMPQFNDRGSPRLYNLILKNPENFKKYIQNKIIK